MVQGAIGDLATAPANLPPTAPFPMAYLAGATGPSNLDFVGLSPLGLVLRLNCYPIDPLALDLTKDNRNDVFSGSANDGLVTITSQLRGEPSITGSGGNTYVGSIHTSALKALGFGVPSELDLESGIPDAVMNLLDEATNGSDFH